MNQWFNGSHPQTLQAGVILGYISGVFGLLGSGPLFIIFIGLLVGAFVTANNKRWGYYLLAVCATVAALFRIVVLVLVGTSFSLVPVLMALNAVVFPAALAAAVLHGNSRQYQKIWFE